MDKHPKILYQFDDFVLDPSQKSLSRAGATVALTPKAIETLLVLVRNGGKVVEKSALLNEIWADTFVEEATLAQNISTLRKVLGTRFIETIPRRGYRFVAEVKEFPAAPRRVHVSGAVDSNGAVNGSNNQIVRTQTDPLAPFDRKPAFGSKRKMFIALAGVVVIAATAIAVALGFYSLRESRFADTKFKQVRFTKLISGDLILRSALSPDGKYLAAVNRHTGGSWRLQVRQIGSENAVEVIPSTSMEFIGLTFSADSQHLYYVAYPKERLPNGARVGNLYKIPLLGGVPEQLLGDIDSPITLSPDGRQFAFVRNNYKEGESTIIVAGFDGRAERKLAARPLRKYFSVTGPAWSPDGKTIASSAAGGKDAGSQMELLTIDAENGETKSLISENLQWIGKIAWLGDGSGIIYAAFFANSQNLTDQIWVSSFPDGKMRLVTNAVEGLRGMSLASDSNSFITIRSARSTNYWIQSLESPSAEPQRIKQNFSEISLVPQSMTLLPDNKIVFDSTKNGNSDIWAMNLDGSGAKPLSKDQHADYAPEISPDGKFMIFLSNRDGAANLWRMNADGTGVGKLTDSPSNVFSGITTDGNFAYFSQRVGNAIASTLWKVPVEGGEPVQVYDKAAFNPKISPDGKSIACFCADPQSAFGLKLTILSKENGALVKQFDVKGMGMSSKMFWSQDGRSIFFLKTQDGVSTVYRQPLDADAPVKVIESKTDEIFRFAPSGDGSFIVYESGTNIQEVILVENVE